ncbi:MAG TPA: hypothetical protein VEY31_14380 [Roseococcus sp.]|nr:hypothetical protein [Roseococcus sp.]
MPEPAASSNELALAAADRLEAALEHLFALLEARFSEVEQDMVPRAEVEALSLRLDETLERLRAALAEQGE